MSRKYNIRWQPADSEQLARAVKNFNAKIKRLEEKHPELKEILPKRAKVSEMKQLIQTRQDLNREINALKRFTKRGSEKIVDVPGNDYNLKTTKWQKQEMTRRVGMINRKRKERLKELESIELESRGEKLGYTKGDIGMGKAEEIAYLPMQPFTKKMNRKDFNHKFENIRRESQSAYWDKRDIMLRDNFIKSLEENFNPNDLEDITKEVYNMDIKEFKQKFYANGGNFELSYPPDKSSYDKYLKALKSTWKPNKGG